MRSLIAMLAVSLLATACGKASTSFNQDMNNYYGNYGQANGSTWNFGAENTQSTIAFSDTTCGYAGSMGPFSDNGDTTLTITASNGASGCLAVSPVVAPSTVATPYACNVSKSMGDHELKTLVIICSGHAAITLEQSLIYHY